MRLAQTSLHVGHKKIGFAALVQAGVDEAELFRALVRPVKIEALVVKDLERGRRSGIAVIRSVIAVAETESDVQSMPSL